MVIKKNKKYDIVGIGNAIVDLISEVDDLYLKENNINKGTMSLVDHNIIDKIINEKKIIYIYCIITLNNFRNIFLVGY